MTPHRRLCDDQVDFWVMSARWPAMWPIPVAPSHRDKMAVILGLTCRETRD